MGQLVSQAFLSQESLAYRKLSLALHFYLKLQADSGCHCGPMHWDPSRHYLYAPVLRYSWLQHERHTIALFWLD
jgi:hypothetical protein